MCETILGVYGLVFGILTWRNLDYGISGILWRHEGGTLVKGVVLFV